MGVISESQRGGPNQIAGQSRSQAVRTLRMPFI
jgi:hypothetical protein